MRRAAPHVTFSVILSLASLTVAEAIEVGNLVIVTTTTQIKTRDNVVGTVYPGDVLTVVKIGDGQILLEGEPEEGKKWSGWVAESKIEKYTGTVEQKLLSQRGISEGRKAKFPGLKFEVKDITIWEVPVEIEGTIHFVPFARVRMTAWYESGKPFDNVYVCAVTKKGTIPSPETLFYDPGLVVDKSIEPKIDDRLKSPRGPIKIPLED